MKRFAKTVAVCGSAVLISSGLIPPAKAMTPTVTEPQTIDLGATSFFDGIGGNGLTYIGYLRFSNGNSIKDASGNTIPAFQNPSIQTTTFISQFVYQFANPKILGAHPGLDLLIPVVNTNSKFSPYGAALDSNGAGLSDVLVGAFLQWDPMVNAAGAVWSNRFELIANLPVGRYDARKDINPGSNFYSLNPNWASTLLFARGWEASWRLNYLYNFSNHDPSGSAPLDLEGAPVSATKAGQAIWLNFALSYEVVPNVHVGANGYYLKQITDDQVNGVAQKNTRERVLGIGPGVMWRAGQKAVLYLNAYTETAVQNRTRNNFLVQAHWVYTFGK